MDNSATLRARYDYFSASIDTEPSVLVERFAKLLTAEPRSRRAVNGYQHAVGLHVGDDPECIVQWNDNGRPNLFADGYPSQRIYELVSAHFPGYGLARGDVCVDFEDHDYFEVIHGAMRRLSHERGVRHSIIGDWETPGSPLGRTTESGARSGRRYRRLYEFKKAHGYGHAVRYEFECKPDSQHKGTYANLGPIELLRTDSYSVELLRRLGFAAERLTVERSPPPASPQAWFVHLVRQYGPKLLALVQGDLGGDLALLGPHIKAAYEAELAIRRSISHAAAAAPAQPFHGPLLPRVGNHV